MPVVASKSQPSVVKPQPGRSSLAARLQRSIRLGHTCPGRHKHFTFNQKERYWRPNGVSLTPKAGHGNGCVRIKERLLASYSSI